MIRFLKHFYKVRSLILWDLVRQEKSVPKTNVFDTLSMNGYYLLVLLLKQQILLLHFYSSSQTAAQKSVSVIKGIGGGVLHNLFDFTFQIALCGVHLFLNGYLKYAEKLITEKYNYKNQIVI